MPLTISTKTYNYDANMTPDSAKYTGPANTATVKDIVYLRRTAPKPTTTFPGVVRANEKTVKSVVIAGVTRDCIAETSFSYPVGTLQADITALRVDHASLMAFAATQTLVDNAKISY